jgi:glutaredoxin
MRAFINLVLKSVAAAFVLFICAAIFWIWYGTAHESKLTVLELDMNPIPGPSSQIQRADNSVIMYSLTTCGRCTMKRRELKAAGIPFEEYFIDQDRAAADQLTRKLIAAGGRGGSIGTPVFEINGQIIQGNPPLRDLQKLLK